MYKRQVEDGLDAVSDDLSDVEETLYFALDDDEDEDEDEDDEEEECFMTNCPECEEEAVSYTHLDVYKRQPGS